MTETHAKNHVLTPSSYRGHVFGLTEIEHFSIGEVLPVMFTISGQERCGWANAYVESSNGDAP